MSKQKRKPSRRSAAGMALMIVALLGLMAVVVSRFTDFGNLMQTLRRGDWTWIAIGVGIHLVFFYCYALLYRIGFWLAGVSSSAWRLLPILFAGIFLNAAVPTAGAGAAALFVDDAVQRGESGPRTMVGVVLVTLLDMVTLLPYVVWGMVFLGRHGLLKSYDWLATALFLAYVAVLLAALALARWRIGVLKWALRGIRHLTQRIGGWFQKPDLLPREWPADVAREFNLAAQAIVSRPPALALAAAWGVTVHAINVLGLWALLKAFNLTVPAGGLVAAFGMGFIFFIIAIIPEGVAIVETVMTLIFTALGISKTAAITATLVFRSVNFWLPLAVGVLALHRIRHFGERRRSK